MTPQTNQRKRAQKNKGHLMSKLGEYLKKAMESKNISKKELAKKIGCSEKSVEMWLSGKSVPYKKTQQKIDSALGMTGCIPWTSTANTPVAAMQPSGPADQITGSSCTLNFADVPTRTIGKKYKIDVKTGISRRSSKPLSAGDHLTAAVEKLINIKVSAALASLIGPVETRVAFLQARLIKNEKAMDILKNQIDVEFES